MVKGAIHKQDAPAEALLFDPIGPRIRFSTALKRSLNDPAWPPLQFEAFVGERLTDESVIVGSYPFFHREFSAYDVVSISKTQDMLTRQFMFERVLRRGGHSTYRVRFFSEEYYTATRERRLRSFLMQLDHLGCTLALGEFSLMVIDVSPETSVVTVNSILKLAEEQGIWEYDAGFVASEN